VLPRDNERVAVVNRDEFAAAVRRVSQFADERSHAIRVGLAQGELKLAASGSESGETEDSVPAEGGAAGGADIQIGFNAQYLLDFLGAIASETVNLELKDEQSAGQLRPAGDADYNYRYVVMPMRI
jgi:DNA polymerase-3 subunit beta